MRVFVVMALIVMAGGAQAAEAVEQTARVTKPHFERMLRADKAVSASAIVKNFYAQLISVMQRGEKLGFQGRYAALKPAIEQAFDLPMMTRFSAGTGWYKAVPEQQAKLVRAFSDFSVATYASRFKAFDNEKFEVLGEKPASGGGVLVETKLTPNGDAPVSLNYLLRLDAHGQWRINDVYLDATISELATRRAEFGAVIKSDGVDALIENISLKAKNMENS